MKKDIFLNVKEMIEIEKWLKENKNKTKTLTEYLEIFFQMTEEQREYLIMAQMMPLEEIQESLEYYDGCKIPIKIDELLFVDNLANKYGIERKLIIKRIKQVRMINIQQKTQNNTKKRKK